MQEAVKEVLKISKLKVSFHTYAGDVKAIDSLELSVKSEEILGLVGESGSGKSVTALTIAGLLPPNAEIIRGEVLIDGKNVLSMKKEEIRTMRLTEVAVIFQDPMTFLNPVLEIGSQISEIASARPEAFRERIIKHRLEQIEKDEGEHKTDKQKLDAERIRLQSSLKERKLGKREFNRLTKLYTISLLSSVRLAEPEKVFKMYPFELSGGMRQRVMIAMALARAPKLLLADEITTALDVTVQAQVLALLKELKREINASILLITHDLGVVAEACDRVAVMYAGNIVEVAPVDELFKNPLHPYTIGLLSAVPRVDV
ncbi:MAG TPA: ABC transporter ATP-binding protein, partial [Nitrososphaerales archaeon]|nr:ABC transporter ATP-binding protein [Nitrososphaerales archaeon]